MNMAEHSAAQMMEEQGKASCVTRQPPRQELHLVANSIISVSPCNGGSNSLLTSLLVTLEDLPVEIISAICSFLPTFNILAMERISSTLREKMMSSNIYMKRIGYLEKNRKITHSSIMLKDISQFSDKMPLSLLYRTILLTRVMLRRCCQQYYNLIWSTEVKEGVIEHLGGNDYFVHNKRYCVRTKLAKEFYRKCYVFARLGKFYPVKLADIIDTEHPDNCFKNLIEIIDWEFKSTVDGCIHDIILDML